MLLLNRLCNRFKFTRLFNIGSLAAVIIASVLINTSCSKSNEKIIAEVGDYEITAKEFEKRYLDYIVASGVEDEIRIRLTKFC